MDLVKVDIDELRYRINKFEQCTNKEAYLIMSANTMSCLESIYPFTIWHSVEYSKTGIVAEFDHRKIFIDKDIAFGKVEIR